MMKRILLLTAILAPLTTLAQSDWEGYWKGVLKVQGMEIEMFFDLTTRDDTWLGTMDVPLQQLKDLPATSVTFDEATVKLMFAQIPGSYEGSMASDGTVQGHWIQGGQQFPLDLVPVDKELANARPQEPTPPFPYESIDVDFTCANDTTVTLAGTLTYPRGADSVTAAVVLVSGSGPQDRNEEIMGHKPFLVLSDFLTRNGIAVLRYDDRGVGGSGGSRMTATVADFTEDAKGAIAYLRAQELVRCEKVGIIGHSEGGMVAAMIGAEDLVDFIVMMAGPGTLLDDLLIDQMLFMNRQAGYSDEVIARDTAFARTLYAMIKSAGTNNLDTAALRELALSYHAESEAIRAQIPDAEQFFRTQLAQVGSAWFRHFLSFVPTDYIRQIKCPVLALNGSLDFQVPPKNLAAIQQALIEGPCIDFEIRNFPGLNHLFQPAQTGHIDEYARITTTIDTVVLETMTRWIHDRN